MAVGSTGTGLWSCDCNCLGRRGKSTCQRVLVLVSGCFLATCASAALVVYVYINALKDTFGMSQTQVGIANAVCVIGFNAGFVPGGLLRILGARKALFCGVTLIGISYTLLYMACHRRSYYSQHPGLVCAFLFLKGLGNSFGYYLPLGLCFQSFAPLHRGKIIGLIVGLISTGKVLFSVIYAAYFVDGHVQDPGNQNLAGFLLTNGVLMVIAMLFAMLFLQVYPPGCEKEQEYEEIVLEPLVKEAPLDITGLQLIRRKDFHLLCWQMILAMSAQHMLVDNMTVYLHSLHLTEFITKITILSPIMQVLFKFLTGFLSDYFLACFLIPRIIFLLVVHLLQTTALLLCVFYADRVGVFNFAVVTVSGAFGAIYTLTPTIMSEQFGHVSLTQDYGFMKVSMSVLSLGLASVFGVLYSREITDPASEDCYGLRCFTWSFAIAFVLSAVAAILNGCSLYYDWKTLREPVVWEAQGDETAIVEEHRPLGTERRTCDEIENVK